MEFVNEKGVFEQRISGLRAGQGFHVDLLEYVELVVLAEGAAECQ
jgi:hypothetical protein